MEVSAYSKREIKQMFVDLKKEFMALLEGFETRMVRLEESLYDMNVLYRKRYYNKSKILGEKNGQTKLN